MRRASEAENGAPVLAAECVEGCREPPECAAHLDSEHRELHAVGEDPERSSDR